MKRKTSPTSLDQLFINASSLRTSSAQQLQSLLMAGANVNATDRSFGENPWKDEIILTSNPPSPKASVKAIDVKKQVEKPDQEKTPHTP